MTEDDILSRFIEWIDTDVRAVFPQAESGRADPKLEDVAWLKLETPSCIAGIKIWKTGDYCVEILPLDDGTSDVTEFGSIDPMMSLGEVFAGFFKKISSL